MKMQLRKTADAYEWVKQRAEHIKDKNPDMNEEESFGIAWKQWKKENPKWKSKKQKERLKKKTKKIKALIDESKREFAIIYINGEFYEAPVHRKAINNYLTQHGYNELKIVRPESLVNENTKFSDVVKELAYGHYMEDGTINIEEFSLIGLDLNTAAQIFKSKYHSDIYCDEIYDPINGFKKIASEEKIINECQQKSLYKKCNILNKLKNKYAEIFTGFIEDLQEVYLEVFKNPTDKEISEIKKQDEYNSIRGVILDDGTIYAWPGMIVHVQINQYLEQKIPVEGVFRFSFDENKWIIDLHGEFTTEQGLDMIKKYESILSRFGNIQTEYFIYGSINSDERYLDLTYEEIYQKVASIKRLMKKNKIV